MGSLQFDQINVVVPDVAGAARFLRSLGADVDEPETDWAEWASHHVGFPASSDGFAADIDSSAFANFWGGVPDGYVGVVLNLRAADRAAVDASFALAIELGADCLRAPYDAFWGGALRGRTSPRSDRGRRHEPRRSGMSCRGTRGVRPHLNGSVTGLGSRSGER